MPCLDCHKFWSTPCPMCVEEYDMKYKRCSICERPDVTHEENDTVADALNQLDMEEFEMVAEAMGISSTWESAIVCQECFDYYTM